MVFQVSFLPSFLDEDQQIDITEAQEAVQGATVKAALASKHAAQSSSFIFAEKAAQEAA